MIPFQGCVILFIGGLFPVVSDWFLEARFSYKCDLLQVNWKTFQDNDPRGLILKIVPHLWSYEASLGKRSGTFAFKAFHALAAALEDDRRPAALASLPPFRYLSPFFLPLSLTTIGSGFQGCKNCLYLGFGSFQTKFGWYGGIWLIDLQGV